MSKRNFEQVGSLWWKRNGKEEHHLVGTMKRGNLIFNVWAYPNKDERNGNDTDFYLLMDEGEIDRSDPFWGYEYFLDNI